MARQSKNLPYDEAVAFVHDQCIGSRKQYIDWHDSNKPKKLPKYPNRVYKEWVSWNEWLGTDNTFDNKRRYYRPLAEAIVWVHKLGLSSQQGWFEFAKGRDNVPEDIPTRPDLVYDDWMSWSHWLGNKPKQIEAQRKVVEESIIFYIIQEQEYADRNTVFTFGVEKGGRSGLKARWDMKKFRVMRMYRYEEQLMDRAWQIIQHYSTKFYGAEDVRIVTNINQLLWDLETLLEVVP